MVRKNKGDSGNLGDTAPWCAVVRNERGMNTKGAGEKQMLSFQEPFITERADPYIVKGPEGTYYFTASYPMRSQDDPEGYDRIILRSADTIEELPGAKEYIVWQAGAGTKTHRFIWAPELHYISGCWYIYYAGSDSTASWWNFDCHVLRCKGSNPCEDEWEELGKFQSLPEDTFSFTGFSLDMTYFEVTDKSYVIWAQHNEEKISCLYIGEVSREEPWKLISMPTLLSKPEYPWEKVRYAVNEGPAVIKHNDKVFVFFSAAGTGSEYCIGLLEYTGKGSILDRTSWIKYDSPILKSEDLEEEYGPGHNSFTKDAEGNDLIVYHARSRECFMGKCRYAGNDPLFDPCRHARIRKLVWTEDGSIKITFR